MTPAILIPSYNTGGPLLYRTVASALGSGLRTIVIIDGSTDDSPSHLEPLLQGNHELAIHRIPENRGKGTAILEGATIARHLGHTHVITMDADGQHPHLSIHDFLEAIRQHPEACIFGQPIFDENAPKARLRGRKISNVLVAIETLGWGIGDVLFGMRAYPTTTLIDAFAKTRWARRFDFDTETAVHLAWAKTPIAHIDVPCTYLSIEDGGISHFRYVRDNLLLIGMHTRLILQFLPRIPLLLWRSLLHPNPLKQRRADIPVRN